MDPNPVNVPAAALVTACVLVSGCQQLAALLPAQPPPDPGKKLVVLPAEVWALEQCDTRDLPYLRLDDSGVTPKTVKAGEPIRYRFAYTACVPAQPGYILGRFQTTIFHEKQKLSTRYDDGYPVETGRLIVDTEIKVPKAAEPGNYSVQAALSVNDRSLTDSVSFNVVP